MNKKEWIEYFKERYKLSEVNISKIDNFEVILPNWKSTSIEQQEDNAENFMATVGAKASYALHCLQCNKTFFNGWYQTKCDCGNKIPYDFLYP